MIRMRFLLACIPLLAACDLQDNSADDVERGNVGKADLIGSCDIGDGDLGCGGPGTGNCWCDESCVEYGDCCEDADDLCGIEMPEGQACGGLLGLACAEDEFCLYAPEDICGAADATGVCTTPPEVCIEVYQPVCGCNGETYANSCFAAAAGTSVAYEGECNEVPQFCGGFAGLQCPDGKTCVDDPSDSCDPQQGGADCGGICVDAPSCNPVMCELYCENGFETDENGCEICQCAEAPEPEECHVAGCSGELCVGPDGPDASICIWEPWYACLEMTHCGNYGENGACGWKQTAAFQACVAEHGAELPS